MSDPIKTRLDLLYGVIESVLTPFQGADMTPELIAKAQNDVRNAVIRMDLARLPGEAAVTDVCDVIVEQDPQDPSFLLCRFRRKDQTAGSVPRKNSGLV